MTYFVLMCLKISYMLILKTELEGGTISVGRSMNINYFKKWAILKMYYIN